MPVCLCVLTVEQQKDMKLGEHLILKVAKLSEEQIAQRGGTLATQIKEMMAKVGGKGGLRIPEGGGGHREMGCGAK